MAIFAAGGIQGHSSRRNGKLSVPSDEEVTAVSFNLFILMKFIMFVKDIIQADFAFFDPKPDDFHGVKILFQTYLDDWQWDLSDFVDLILAQTTVGNMVKIEDDEADCIFAFVTVLNLRRYKLRNYQPMALVMAVEANQAPTFWRQLQSLID
ncbi:hypothetical protein Ancab_035469 [Ancistrocladus abbreviatus]